MMHCRSRASPDIRCRLLLAIAVAIVVTLGSGIAAAATGPRPASVAIFPLLSIGDPDAEIVRVVNESLESVAASLPDARTVTGEELRKTLKTAPEAALASCKEDLRCIARLGKRARADELLLGQARPAAQGVIVMFIAFSSDTGAVTRKVRLEVGTAAEAAAIIGDNFYALLGITTVGYVEVDDEDFAGNVRIDGTVVGQGWGSYPMTPGRHAVVLGSYSVDVMVHPGKTVAVAPPKLELQPIVAAPPASPLSPASGTTGIGDSGSRRAWSNTRWTGVGLIVGSAVPFAMSLMYGLKMRDTERQVGPGTSQIETAAKQADIEWDRNVANTASAVGSCLLVAGIIAFGYDWYVVPTPAVTSKVSGGQLVLGGRF